MRARYARRSIDCVSVIPHRFPIVTKAPFYGPRGRAASTAFGHRARLRFLKRPRVGRRSPTGRARTLAGPHSQVTRERRRPMDRNSRRTAGAWAAPALGAALVATVLAGPASAETRVTFVETFENGANEGGWTFGTGYEYFVDSYGNPGRYLRDSSLVS